jgi:hypothetical protein
MTSDASVVKARCVHCREDVPIDGRYAHGDHIKCGACGTKHKVVRGDRLRLVLADAAPVREALTQNEQLILRLQQDLVRARRSFGLGANGILVGVAFAAWRLWRGAPIDADLLTGAALVALGAAVLIEAANWSFLGKRLRIARLSREIAEAEAESGRLRGLVREANRV